MKVERRTLWQIFRVPLVLGLLSLLGLISALVGDGGYDVLSWVTLGTPLAVGGWYWLRRQARSGR
ncbi:MAG TPA: hypothetical protein VM553_16025 [Dongiaceae bacterium]|nr:hypothetical protein [Dongiaceae bacterium]